MIKGIGFVTEKLSIHEKEKEAERKKEHAKTSSDSFSDNEFWIQPLDSANNPINLAANPCPCPCAPCGGDGGGGGGGGPCPGGPCSGPCSGPCKGPCTGPCE